MTGQDKPTSSLPLHASNDFAETAASQLLRQDVHRQNVAGR